MEQLDALVDRLAAELAAAGIEYAFGGALALSYWAPPRATADIDLNMFLPDTDVDRGFDALARAGFLVDRPEARVWAIDRGDFRAWAGPVRLDVFLPFSPFHDAVRQRTVSKPSASGRLIQVLSAEDLILFKVLFDRPKDWIDVQNMVTQRGALLETSYLRKWAAELLPDGDTRLRRLHAVLTVQRG